MQLKCKLGGVLAALLASFSGLGQTQCPNAVRIEGTVRDPAGAIIPGAQVQSSDGEKTTTDAKGQYVLPCGPVGTVKVRVEAQRSIQEPRRSERELDWSRMPTCNW